MKSANPSEVAEQLAMFERQSAWHWAEAQRLQSIIRRSSMMHLPAKRARRALEEISRRSLQMLREYWAWMEQEGLAEAVREILAKRRESSL